MITIKNPQTTECFCFKRGQDAIENITHSIQKLFESFDGTLDEFLKVISITGATAGETLLSVARVKKEINNQELFIILDGCDRDNEELYVKLWDCKVL